jgi:hypothetical protein
MLLQNHGIRVLLRLLARSLPPACLSELFGCLMNVAADVGGEVAISLQLLLAFLVLRVMILVPFNTSATAFYAQPAPLISRPT